MMAVAVVADLFQFLKREIAGIGTRMKKLPAQIDGIGTVTDGRPYTVPAAAGRQSVGFSHK